MRSAISLADYVAFYVDCAVTFICYALSFCLAVHIICGARAKNKELRNKPGPNTNARTLTHIFNRFNVLLILMGVSIATCCLFEAFCVDGSPLPNATPQYWLPVVFSLSSFEACYTTYAWSRSAPILKQRHRYLYATMYMLSIVNPVFFLIQFVIACLLVAGKLPIVYFRVWGPIVLLSLFLFDAILVLAFTQHLQENSCTSSNDGNVSTVEYNTQVGLDRTKLSIVARHGIWSCVSLASCLVLDFLSQLVPTMGPYLNLLNSFALVFASLSVGILFVMKLRLDSCRIKRNSRCSGSLVRPINSV
ncbi:hypothetical protein BC830DRAFT_1099274 [Chytriomyces sp. MP71]|nr:hypothetical protein BC830DRAFT_1099274 [Chytriomyces sp. MP71]